MDYFTTEFANTAHCVCPLLTWRIPRKSVCTTTTRATWCTHRPTPRQPTPDKKELRANLLRIEKGSIQDYGWERSSSSASSSFSLPEASWLPNVFHANVNLLSIYWNENYFDHIFVVALRCRAWYNLVQLPVHISRWGCEEFDKGSYPEDREETDNLEWKSLKGLLIL